MSKLIFRIYYAKYLSFSILQNYGTVVVVDDRNCKLYAVSIDFILICVFG